MSHVPFIVPESSSLFMDAYALEGERWIFGSFWASETVLQEFFARLTLPSHEFGLRSFTTIDANGNLHKRIHVGDAARLSKISAKTPSSTIVGSLCNVWIFDPALQKPDRSSGECYVLTDKDVGANALAIRIWGAVKDLSALPLLDHWKDNMLKALHTNDWIIPLDGFGVGGFRVSLPAEPFEELVSEGIRAGYLPIQPPLLEPVVSVVEQATLW